MGNNRLYVILPCYNEESNIKKLVQDWLEELKKLPQDLEYHIVMIDDGSKDHTAKVGEVLSKQKGVSMLAHKQNKGLGEALNTGLKFVLNQNDAKYVCIMDADQTHRPEYINVMLEKIRSGNYGCVIASRYQKGSRVEGLSSNRVLLSHCAKYVYKLCFGVKGVRDYTCGYRLYDIVYLEKLRSKYGERIVQETSFACMAELLYKLAKVGCSFGEIPFVLKYQLKDGVSKMKIVKTTNRSLATIVRLRFY